MKACSKCHTERSDSEFSWGNKEHTVRNSVCKSCHNVAGKQYFQKHKDHLQDLQRKRRRRTRDFLDQYLGSHPCVDCGCSDIRVLQFDHIRGEKVDAVATMSRRTLPIEQIEEEIKKCEVRCSNCHIIRHYENRRNGNEVRFKSG